MHVHRTYRAKIRNHSQVARILDLHAWSASKLWNVANYHSREVWEDTGEIPDDSDLKSELKTHNKYKGLHSQSSQRVLEELAEAFNSWYSKRKSDNRANPPGYRKKNSYDNKGNRVHEEHPRSTVTWKQKGIRHDSNHNRVRLSKGANHKDHPRDWDYILVEYETRPEVTVENLQQVRAVYSKSKQRGNYTSSANTKWRRLPHPAPRRRVSTLESVTSPPSLQHRGGRPLPRQPSEARRVLLPERNRQVRQLKRF